MVAHGGGALPFLAARLDRCWEVIPACRVHLDRKPSEVLRQIYADTALFGAWEATKCGLRFFGPERVLFASDSPFDPEKGTYYIRETLKILDGLKLSKAKYKAIMHGNLEKLTGRKLVK